MSNAIRSKKTTGALVGFGVVVVVIILSMVLDFFNTIENKTYDLRYSNKVSSTVKDTIEDVVIVDIDDASMMSLGRFQNWPRLYHAKVVDYLYSGGAKAIAFDIFFTEPDSLTKAMIQLYKDTKLEKFTGDLRNKKIKFKEDSASQYIDAVLDNWGYDSDFNDVSKYSNIVYFPFYVSTPKNLQDSSDITIREKAFIFDSKIAGKYDSLLSEGRKTRIGMITAPIPLLLTSAKGTGTYNIEPDNDGAVRRQPLFISLNGRSYPSMDFQIVMDQLGINKDQVKVELGKFITLGDKMNIPIDKNGRMLITYFGGFRKFRYISYVDVLTEQVPAEYFNNKTIIVGATAAGLMDLRVVPFSNGFPGPEIHANIIKTLMTGKFIKVYPWYFTLAILLVVGLITVLVSLKFKPMTASAILLALVLFYLVAANVIFAKYLIWVEVVRPMTVILFTNMAILGYRYLTEEKQKVWIKNMFQGYMSKDLVDKIMANPEMLLMGGDKKEVTVFFSDIKGFSSFSEKLGTPERLIALINEYLGAMSDVVLEYGGYISKYEGDAIMAFWGAPTDDPKHAETCIKCVWAMNQRLQILNADLAKRNMPNLFTRFGLNTGLVTVGNVGSEKKKSYTAMGDSINLGSRLEGANKEYGTAIMMSEFTYAKVQGLYPVRELDMLRVVGKEQPVRVYELLGLSEADVSEKKKKAVEIYLKGLELYRSKQWDQAEAMFRQALEVDPDDGPSQAYIGRCEDFKVLPPPENWDGVFVMKTK